MTALRKLIIEIAALCIQRSIDLKLSYAMEMKSYPQFKADAALCYGNGIMSPI